MPKLKDSANPPREHLTIFCEPEFFSYLHGEWLRLGTGDSFGCWVLNQATRRAGERWILYRYGEKMFEFTIPGGFFNFRVDSLKKNQMSVRITPSHLNGLRDYWTYEHQNRISTLGFGSWVAWLAVCQTVKDSI